MTADEEIEVGDIVESVHDTSLDPRRVIAVGVDWLLLDFHKGIYGADLVPLPKTYYRIVRKGER